MFIAAVDETTTCARRWEVKIILGRKIRLLFGRKRVGGQIRKRINQRGVKRTAV